jgi:hypothetical protein
VARIAFRAASARDAERLVADGVLGGALPAGDSWQKRVSAWLEEMQAGRRLVMVAECDGHVAGLGQLVFAFAHGYEDAEAANGADIAMVETIRTSPAAPLTLADRMMMEFEGYARKRRVKTLTVLVPAGNDRALLQVKGWGFEEFRSMPQGAPLIAFLRKQIAR